MRFYILLLSIILFSCNEERETSSKKIKNKSELTVGEFGKPLSTSDYNVTVTDMKQCEKVDELSLPVLNDSAYVILTVIFKNRYAKEMQIDCGVLGIYDEKYTNPEKKAFVTERALILGSCMPGTALNILAPLEEKKLLIVFTIPRGFPGFVSYFPTTDLSLGIPLAELKRTRKS